MKRILILSLLIIIMMNTSLAGYDWVLTTLPTATWSIVATSADGRHVYAGGTNTSIYYSDDYGVTWVQRSDSPSSFWSDLAVSRNGSTVIGSYRMNSTVRLLAKSTDFGVTWTNISTPAQDLYYLDCSDDCQYVVASSYIDLNPIQISSDYGASWSSGFSENWDDVCISGTGQYIFATDYISGIFRSANFGGSFTEVNSSRWGEFITCSRDGSVVAFTDSGSGLFGPNGLYISTAFGAPNSFNRNQLSLGAEPIAGSDDMTKIYAGGYFSADSGSTWFNTVLDPQEAVSDQDGTRFYVVSGNQVYYSNWTNYCGDNTCSYPTEDYNICPADCTGYCGDAICDPTETVGTCQVDCGVPASGGTGGQLPQYLAEDQTCTCNPGYEYQFVDNVNVVTNFEAIGVPNYVREDVVTTTCGIDADQNGVICDANEDFISCPDDCNTPQVNKLFCFGPGCLWDEYWFLFMLLIFELMITVYLIYQQG